MRCLAIAALSLGVWATSAAATCGGNVVSVGNGFRNGEALVHMSDHDLGFYVEGSIDAVQGAMLFGATLACFSAINACIANKTNEQLAAMVRKYLNDHPDQWHMGGPIIIYDAIFRECISRGNP
jgi:hypothetical protein